MHVLMKLKGGFTRTLEAVLAVLAGVLVLDVVWQVVTRFVLKHPSSWTEELAAILLIWVSLLGAAVAYERGSHLGVDILTVRLGPRGQAVVQAFVALCALAFAGFILVGGGQSLVEVTFKYQQTTPALGIPRAWVYLALPVSGASLGLFALGKLVEAVLGKASAPGAAIAGEGR